MRAMSLDVGTKTIGIATSDLMWMIANGVETIRRTSVERDFTRIGELIKEHEVSTLVVGYPKNMNGSIGERAQICEAFAEELRNRFPACKVVLWDERLTTVSAHNAMIEGNVRREDRSKVVDKVAAVFILQGYLDMRSRQ